MMIAFDADASSTSDSFTAPTPAWMMRIFTFSSRQLRQRVGEHFGRALHVGLDDDRQLLHAAFGDLRLQRLEREPRALARRAPCDFACSSRKVAICRAFAASADLEHVARLRQPAEAEHFDRRRRPGGLGRLAAVVDQRAHAADDRAGDERVADAAACRPGRARSPPGRGPCPAWLRARCPTRSASGWP